MMYTQQRPKIILCKSQFCIRYYLPFPVAQNLFALLATLHEIEEYILEFQDRLKSSPRSDPKRSIYLRQLRALRTQRWQFSHQKSDLDKALTHATEAVLLTPTHDAVLMFFLVAAILLSRYKDYNQPDDIKYSLKYFRFLRNNFHSLEAFDIPEPSGDLPSSLLSALAHNLLLTPGDMEQDFEEMLALIPEFVTADALTYGQQKAMNDFYEVLSRFMKTMFRQEDTQKVADRTIQVLRKATVLNPDSIISLALVNCLCARFETTFTMNDYDEAIGIADKIVATCSPGNTPTESERTAMLLISMLLVSRLHSSSRPDYIEDAVHRIRAFVPCLPDEDRTPLAAVLDSLTRQHFDYFGITGNSDGRPTPYASPYFRARYRVSHSSEVSSQKHETLRHLMEVNTAMINGEITDIEAAVESSRTLLPSQQSNLWSSGVPHLFAGLLFAAYQCTKRSNYLDEAITMFRNLRNMSAEKRTWVHFNSGWILAQALEARLDLFGDLKDLEERMQLFPELANDDSGEVFIRVKISLSWAITARITMHPSASIAYETAMSLLQETLVFCPTLQTQHHRLAQAFGGHGGGDGLPSDYASYQVQNGQVKQAVETLERGRALIWSEMRGLRTSTDQLRAANPTLADKFVDINQRLEAVAMSVAQSDDDEFGRRDTGRSIGHLVLTQQRLLAERNSLISHIQSLPGFEHFLKSPSFDFLNSATSHGPVIIVNQTHILSHIILLRKNSRPFIISTPSSFSDRANQLEKDLIRVRKEKGLDSEDYGRTLASVLADLYELVGKRVIDRLRKFKVPEKSRVWWCPTGAFCSLPLHAMGPIPSADGRKLYFSDLYIPSYTPSLSALIESRKHGSLSDASDNLKPSILLVAQPDTLPGAVGEITVIQATKTPVTTLISGMATPKTVIEGLRGHRFAHFVCHGLLETGKPFDASLELHEDNLTLLNIVGSRLPAAEFVFLSACHTAELTEGSLSDEGLHLAAAMQYCGFRSVVGTMWAMADTDGADLSKHFYKAIFADRADQNGVPYHERSARALQLAVKKLRNKRGMTLERWVNFVHYGA